MFQINFATSSGRICDAAATIIDRCDPSLNSDVRITDGTST